MKQIIVLITYDVQYFVPKWQLVRYTYVKYEIKVIRQSSFLHDDSILVLPHKLFDEIWKCRYIISDGKNVQ